MTQFEYFQFVRLKLFELYNLVHGKTCDQAMQLKKEIQMALTVYSKNKQGRLDALQEKTIAMMSKIEKWVKRIYIQKQMKYLRRNCPNMTESGRKAVAREAWESYNRSMSY